MSVHFDLASVGYATHEHFASGVATRYEAAGAFEPDGRWAAEPREQAAFTTRIVIYRPADAARANGTVIVEWLNVTGGLDIPALWMPTHRHLIREGFTWVGVTAQRVGLVGGGMMPGMGLLASAPERYGTLEHPGDAYTFDMFSQIGRAVRELLPQQYGIPVARVLATGASQSAFHLTTYVNAVDPLAQVFDGFLLQGRAGAAAPLEGWELRSIDAGNPSDIDARRSRLRGRDNIRADARVPVMVVQSETDVFGTLAYLPARQPDSEHFRLWEVAGAAHCDTYFLCAAGHDSGSLPAGELAELIDRAEGSGMPTEVPINAGPQMHYVLQRAFDALDGWVRDRTAPPSATRLAVDGDDLARDDVGIGRGGVRTPWVDVPVAVFSGLGQPGDMMQLFGTTTPIDPAMLAARYPGGRADYVAQFRAAAKDAVRAGFVLDADEPEIDALADYQWTD
jgi:hypothetical protein